MTVEFLAEIQPVAEAREIRDGWRGIVDFGEVWTEQDAHLWSPEWGDLPVGKPLVYGCEVKHDPAPNRVRVTFLMLQEAPNVIQPGSVFTLRDGLTHRASGRVI